MKKLLVVFLIIVTLAGCVQVTAPPVAVPSSKAQQPVTSSSPASNSLTPNIVTFDATPSTIPAGDTSTLKWVTTGAVSVSINQEIGPVALNGSMPVTPLATITYTLSATNKYGTSTATAQVIVQGVRPVSTPSSFNLPVVAILKVEPANILSGQTAVLTWEVQNSFDVTISPGFSIIPVKGSREVSPAFPTTYKLTTTNDHGTIIATTTLTVSGVQPNEETPVIKYLIATPYVILKGESSTLSWTSVEGSSASIDKGVGIVDGSGTTRVTPKETTTYMLTVTNPRGAQFQTVTVNVK
ncbi:MAG: DUF4148 domain-containing protein [Chloroflexi bacterium]|nr:DUF4148 domain-containing protein [Chloroflexota bacterium]